MTSFFLENNHNVLVICCLQGWRRYNLSFLSLMCNWLNLSLSCLRHRCWVRCYIVFSYNEICTDMASELYLLKASHGILSCDVCMQVNSLRSSDVIWLQKSWATLVKVMDCGLMAPSHYLNQCWLIISKILWYLVASSILILLWVSLLWHVNSLRPSNAYMCQ